MEKCVYKTVIVLWLAGRCKIYISDSHQESSGLGSVWAWLYFDISWIVIPVHASVHQKEKKEKRNSLKDLWPRQVFSDDGFSEDHNSGI